MKLFKLTFTQREIALIRTALTLRRAELSEFIRNRDELKLLSPALQAAYDETDALLKGKLAPKETD